MMGLPLDKRSAVRLVFGFAAAVGLLALFGNTLREPITNFGEQIVARLGLAGLFGAVVLLDPVPGVGFQTVFFFGYTGGIALGPLILASWVGVMVAAVGSWGLGRLCSRWNGLVAFLERWRVGPLLRAYGPRAIAVAAIAPFPFGVATFGAGVMRVPLRVLVFGAAFRGIKVLFTAAAFWLGWGIGAS
jgi:hypothetical protein